VQVLSGRVSTGNGRHGAENSNSRLHFEEMWLLISLSSLVSGVVNGRRYHGYLSRS
jgi:hypothetical protein